MTIDSVPLRTCGGYGLSVKLTQGSKSCETGKIEEFNEGEVLKWDSHNKNLGNCSSTEFDLAEPFLYFNLIHSLENEDKYCPKVFQVNFEHGIYYEKTIGDFSDFGVHRYTAANNDKVHSAKEKGNCLYTL